MLQELAVVVKIENRQVWVESGQNRACGSCRQNTSCTTSALGGVLKKKPVPVDCSIPLRTGDQVIVAIDETLLLRASLALYLLPLIALFTGASVADWLLMDNAGYADLWIAGSAWLSFSLSLWSINKTQNFLIRNTLWSFTACPRPVVVRKR